MVTESKEIAVCSIPTDPIKGDARRIQCPQCIFNKGNFCYKRLKDVDDLYFLKWCPMFLFCLRDILGHPN